MVNNEVRQPVSAVIITLNESFNLKKSLPKLYWCNEIIVVDSGSSDDTVAVAKHFGCKVFNRSFDNYGSQKKYAFSLAKNNWILSIDADEVLSDNLVGELKSEMRSPAFTGYYVPINLVFMGKVFKFGKEARMFRLRLFNKKFGTLQDNNLHEKILVQGNVKKLKGRIYHYSYKNYEQYFNKFNNYSSVSAQIAYDSGKKKTRGAILLAIPFNFFKCYVLDGNFMNGFQGFCWAIVSSYYVFIKYLKITELYTEKLSYRQPCIKKI